MNVNECLSAVEDWMDSNRVRLNNKTEFLWRTTSRRQHRLPATGPTIGSSLIKPFSVARDLGVFIDSDLSDCLALFQYATPAAVPQYPTATTDCCFIVTGRCNALVLSRLDYCNSLLDACQLDSASSVGTERGSTAHGRIRRPEHITDALFSFQWFCVRERILFKIAVATYRALNGSAPVFPSSYFTRVTDMPSRQRLRSASSNQPAVPPFNLSTVGKRAFPVSGANFWKSMPLPRHTWHLHRRSRYSEASVLRHFSFTYHDR